MGSKRIEQEAYVFWQLLKLNFDPLHFSLRLEERNCVLNRLINGETLEVRLESVLFKLISVK